MNLKSYYLQINVSWEASVNFQHISQNATLATEFARCRHFTQPWQCDVQKTRNTTPLKCCACQQNEDGHVQSAAPCCRTCHRHGHSDLARTVADGCGRFCRGLRTVANGCGRLRKVAHRRANTTSTPRPPEWNRNPCYAFGKTVKHMGDCGWLFDIDIAQTEPDI